MKVIIFVLDNLNIGKTIQKKLLKLYEVWNNIYILSHYKEFTEYDLNDFEFFKWFSTKTYVSLHKDFVKKPYYLINKQNIENQILKMVQRQAVASKLLSRKPKNFKTITPFKFTNLIWTIKLYSSVTLENGSIIRATEDFYSKAWYSNVKVAMNSEELLEYLSNDRICYGQWYDFKSTNDPYYYECSRLKKTELYNIIDIEAIKKSYSYNSML
ncbi:hypothetical protein F8M41_000425 [Gigaspora margarita]|uniref:Uncharacterized protein n=1 Tax=Gigaspora margarita TaxID=4874 RepID=A0A8H4A8N0_GIGMA|nr:hypothetical protein F8M41_000425 [Gigaspora margarita]